MGWLAGSFGIVILLLLAAGATVVICKRYSVGWQCGYRDVWIICEEWRRKLAWLWAPREEKVGLVKAQHPTAQAVPGLYRQSSTNSSQYIMHSDSDLRLDAQGAFTRFEAVDRDLHPPSSPLHKEAHQQQQSQQSSPITCSTSNIPPQPLRPAPQPRATARPRPSPLRAPSSVDYLRLRECEPTPPTPPPPPALSRLALHHHQRHQQVFLFQNGDESPPPLPPPPPAPDALRHHRVDFGTIHRSGPMMFHGRISHNPFDEPRKIRYNVQGVALNDQLFDSKEFESSNDTSPPYGSYEIVHERDFDSIFAPQPESFMHRVPSTRNLQDLERITRYIQSLPDAPLSFEDEFEDEDEDATSGREVGSPAAAPPPPAPPDPEEEKEKKGEEVREAIESQTTGEKIFNALRAVTSQSYIDASEFYNSILTSAQHVQSLAFNPSSNAIEENKYTVESEQQQPVPTNPFTEYRQTELPRRGLDLFSPELNQEAQRTAQQVYNSLQDPPASPLLVKEVEQQAYSYMSDPSFTRTSEDIFNSLEHRRKSVQDQLNGIQELLQLESSESTRRRNSQELLSALEEAQLKRGFSFFDECPQIDDQQILVDELAHTNLMRRNSSPIIPSFDDEMENLQRAVSCESVCSDTSVHLNDLEPNNAANDAQVVGMICVGLEHDRWPSYTGESDLIVSVLEARDLMGSDGRPAQNTFARVCLLPDRETHVQTRLYKGTNSPSYQEKFYFPLDGGPVGRTLLVEVFSYELPNGGCAGGESNLLGEASLRLNPAPRPPATTWLPLVAPALAIPHLGELMFSLSYLPTAERLTLVVVKARNLKGANETPGDFFVKVYLLQQGKKIHKKRTSIKRGEKSPIFNEAIIFSVPAHTLQNIQLRLTVAEVSGDLSNATKAYSVGHVIVGATTSGRALAHWRQMLAALRRPVAMWHPLRK